MARDAAEQTATTTTTKLFNLRGATSGAAAQDRCKTKSLHAQALSDSFKSRAPSMLGADAACSFQKSLLHDSVGRVTLLSFQLYSACARPCSECMRECYSQKVVFVKLVYVASYYQVFL